MNKCRDCRFWGEPMKTQTEEMETCHKIVPVALEMAGNRNAELVSRDDPQPKSMELRTWKDFGCSLYQPRMPTT